MASYLVDHDPPPNWNYLRGRNWSQKWIIAMSLGPWNENRADEVMDEVLRGLGRRSLRELQRRHRLPYPKLSGDWQWEWTVSLSEYLRDHDVSETVFFRHLRNIDGGGVAARAVLRAICGAWGTSKTIDYFVREALDLEVIPVDRWVSRALKSAGLSTVAQQELIAGCRRLKVKPQRLARALYKAASQSR